MTSPEDPTDSAPGGPPLPRDEGLYRLDGAGGKRRPPPLMVGKNGLQVLRGRRLAHGSFTKLYLGVDSQLRPLAVRVHRLPERKVFSEGRAGRPCHKVRATQESTLEAIAAEDHVARLAGCTIAHYDAGSGEGRRFAFDELMLSDLNTVVDRVGWPYRANKLAALSLRLVTAGSHCLARAHAAGVIHNDLKPENFLFDAHTQDFHLGDFGSSIDLGLCDDLSRYTGGTEEYMAPELRDNNGSPSQQSDVWSLAATAVDIAFSAVDALGKLGPQRIREHLTHHLGARFADFLVDRVGAADPRRRPSASRCAEVFTEVARSRTGARARAIEELLDGSLEAMSIKLCRRQDKELARLTGLWEDLRQGALSLRV